MAITPKLVETDEQKTFTDRIRTELGRIAEPFFFEKNDSITRNHLENAIKLYFSYLFKRGLIYDYTVRCDVINNPPELQAKGQLVCDTAFKLSAGTSSFIYLPVILTGKP